MKTLRLFGLTLMAILLSVNFTSCSKDDDPTKDPEKLVGEWILTHEKYSWTDEDGDGGEEYSYDFNNPKNGSAKMIIEEGSNKNEFIINNYYYYSGKWEDYGKLTIRLEGENITILDEEEYEDIVSSKITYSLKDKILTLKSHAKYEDGSEENSELTYQKK